MSSSYKRDDKEFRARIAKLADEGLHLAQPGSPAYAQAQFTPEFQRHLDRINNAKTHTEVYEAQAAALNYSFNQFRVKYESPKQTPKGRLPELLAGLIWWSPVIAGVIVFLHWLIVRGAH